jgi:DNA mismatch endonuclease (patch repair protein)
MSAATAPVSRWLPERPPDRAWRGRKGRTPRAASREQDRAAGGRELRLVDIGDQATACGSVALKLLPKQRRIRAYLRWSVHGRTETAYIGEVTESTRAANLRSAWDKARAAGLLRTPIGSWATSPASRAVMRANKGRDTRPEIAVRSAIHGMGLRYRVGVRPLPGLRRTGDVVFPRERVTVFIDGCYWHGCPDHYRPSTGKNASFWTEKIAHNRTRDDETNDILTNAGWIVVRAWEHENAQDVATRVRDVVLRRR